MARATALEGVFDAQADWDRAIRGHEQVLPELGRSPHGWSPPLRSTYGYTLPV
jgi:hypothetical protein